MFYSKFMNHSQKEHSPSALIDIVEKNKQFLSGARRLRPQRGTAVIPPPPFSQLYSLAYNIFVERRHFSHSNCSVDASLFYTSPTEKEGVTWDKLNSEMCVFSGLFDIHRDLTILTWSWPFPWASSEKGTPPMQPDLQQRREEQSGIQAIKQSFYIYSNTFQGGETQTHLRTAHNTQSRNKVIPATCWSKSHLHTFFTHTGYTVI